MPPVRLAIRKHNAIQQQNNIHQGAASHEIRLTKSLVSKTVAHSYMRSYKPPNVLSRYWVQVTNCALGANSLSRVDRSALPLSRPNFESSLTHYSGSRFKTSMAFGGPVCWLGHACMYWASRRGRGGGAALESGLHRPSTNTVCPLPDAQETHGRLDWALK